MPNIFLPDGNKFQFDSPVTIMQVAERIGPGLAKAALAGEIDGILVDTSHIIEKDSSIRIITEKNSEGLEIIRHSCAHLLAQAVKVLYPEVQVTIGPVIEDGFYYDFAKDTPFTEEDLENIEKKMAEIVKQDLPVQRFEFSREQAIEKFKSMGENYKVELIQELPESEILSFYQQGSFIDLCRGPHVPNTGKIKSFKLLSVAGAYWRGDSSREMLQRIYGTAFADKKQLKAHLHLLEEAKKRDHRKLAKKLKLFHFQEEAPGMVFWHPNGWVIFKIIEQYIRDKLTEANYQEVHTPELVMRSLWEKSGHWDKFQEDMFTVDVDKHDYAIKPMNCPCHIQIFNQSLKSHHDLPIRMAEFGSCHRNEASGALHGLMRLRNFVQDDAHIFCTESQIQAEVADFIDLLFKVYRDFGFEDIIIKLSTRPQKRVGSDEIWDKAEQALEQALDTKGLEWQLYPGEGAFYGPKIEFSLKDCIGRVWQCGTVQVDFSMPERLDATFINEQSGKTHPVMLHRAILGSIERFIGILIEEFAGNFPTWLAPKQAAILNISENQANYCEDLYRHLSAAGIRSFTDLRNEKIGYKIREHTMSRVPYLLVIGDKEVNSKLVSVRDRESNDLGQMSVNECIKYIQSDVAKYAIKQT